MGTKGLAVAFPLVMANGNVTSKTTARTAADEILRRAGYTTVSHDRAMTTWKNLGLPKASAGHMPTTANLRKFASALHVNRVLYGTVSWHTRSIWVNAGPKTISTATVNGFIYDASANKIVFRSRNVEGRSDEKSNGWKLAADVFFTPLVTSVSGGPATPQEQRAVQVALGLTFVRWVRPNAITN